MSLEEAGSAGFISSRVDCGSGKIEMMLDCLLHLHMGKQDHQLNSNWQYCKAKGRQ